MLIEVFLGNNIQVHLLPKVKDEGTIGTISMPSKSHHSSFILPFFPGATKKTVNFSLMLSVFPFCDALFHIIYYSF